MDRLTKDELIVAALATGKSYPAAAAEAGVSPRTVRRRLQEPAFAERVARARTAYVDQTTAQLHAASASAVSVLRELLAAESLPIRMRAAIALLQVAPRWRDEAELERRLQQVEAAAAALAEKDATNP